VVATKHVATTIDKVHKRWRLPGARELLCSPLVDVYMCDTGHGSKKRWTRPSSRTLNKHTVEEYSTMPYTGIVL